MTLAPHSILGSTTEYMYGNPTYGTYELNVLKYRTYCMYRTAHTVVVSLYKSYGNIRVGHSCVSPLFARQKISEFDSTLLSVIIKRIVVKGIEV